MLMTLIKSVVPSLSTLRFGLGALAVLTAYGAYASVKHYATENSELRTENSGLRVTVAAADRQLAKIKAQLHQTQGLLTEARRHADSLRAQTAATLRGVAADATTDAVLNDWLTEPLPPALADRMQGHPAGGAGTGSGASPP